MLPNPLRLDPRTRRPRVPPQAVGSALRRVDLLLGLALAVLWGQLAIGDVPRGGLPWETSAEHLPFTAAIRFALAISALLLVMRRMPRGATVLGAAFGLPFATPLWSPLELGAAVLASALRWSLWSGRCGIWLKSVRQLERRRGFALIATGLAGVDRDPASYRVAGDCYEVEGRARQALADLGAAPSRGGAALRHAALGVGRALARIPRCRALLCRAVRGLARRLA